MEVADLCRQSQRVSILWDQKDGWVKAKETLVWEKVGVHVGMIRAAAAMDFWEKYTKRAKWQDVRAID